MPRSSSSSPPSPTAMPPSLDARVPSSLTVPSSSSSTSSPTGISPLPTPTPTAHGIRSQLGGLLPKHALFQVHLHIDQLSNVPLVKGQFAVRWKFKNAQSGSSLLAKMKGTPSSAPHSKDLHRGRSSSRHHKGKGRAAEIGLGIGVGPQIQVTYHDEHNDDLEHQVPSLEGEADLDLELLDQEVLPPRSSYDSEDLPTATNSNSRPLGRPRLSQDSANYGQYLTSSPPQTPLHTTSPLPSDIPSSAPTPTITKPPLSDPSSQSEARGITAWSRLQSYNTKWQHKLNLVVQMDVHRESNDLLPSELKLVVMQRVVQGDPDAPHQPRLGVVYLNLAEYAGAGPVTRRYLLRESKTNATLKLTIELEHIGGTKTFVPPPLKKGEILAEVSGLLSNNDLLRTRLARNLDLYTRSGSATPIGSFEPTLASSNQMPLASSPTLSNRRHRHPYSTENGSVDFKVLANVTGLHTTENLIETLFNPVPTASRDSKSPFTVYEPQKAKEREYELRKAERERMITESRSTSTTLSSNSSYGEEGERSSMADADDRDSYSASEESSFTRSSHSNSGSGSQESGGRLHLNTTVAGEKQHWWQKISRSRPGTPVSRSFKLPATGAIEV